MKTPDRQFGLLRKWSMSFPDLVLPDLFLQPWGASLVPKFWPLFKGRTPPTRATAQPTTQQPKVNAISRTNLPPTVRLPLSLIASNGSITVTFKPLLDFHAHTQL